MVSRAQYRKSSVGEPRSMLKEKAAFGSVGSLPAPAEGISTEDHRYRAALVQHVLANQVRSCLKLSGSSVHEYVADFQDVPGMSGERVLRVLRGETTATYADLAFWCREFPQIIPHVTGAIGSWVPKHSPKPEQVMSEPVQPASRIQPQRPPMR